MRKLESKRRSHLNRHPYLIGEGNTYRSVDLKPMPSPLTPIETIRANVAALLACNLHTTSIDDLKESIKMLADTIISRVVPTPVGTRVFRGREFDANAFPSHVSELGARHPSQVKELQRCNRIGDSMFYCAADMRTAFQELKKGVGERIIVSEWEVTRSFGVVHLGYHPEVFKRLGAERTCPEVWPPSSEPFPYPEHRAQTAELDRLYSELFTQDVPRGQEERYKPSIAITEFFLHKSLKLWSLNNADAICYPSVQGRADTDNVAIRYETAQTHLHFLGARELEMTLIEGEMIHYKSYKSAKEDNSEGRLRWHRDVPRKFLVSDSSLSRYGFSIPEAATGL